MARPFFSVVVPTKNRAGLVGLAIQSVLLQRFGDFELIVVDNDDDAGATSQAVRQFDDARIKYVRTGGLPMPDNWERGYAEASGRYMTMLQDKMAMKCHALERVHDLLSAGGTHLVTWPMDTLFDLGPFPLIDRVMASGKAVEVTTDSVLELFITKRLPDWAMRMPYGYNSCLSAELADRIRKGPVGRLCLPVAPDATMAFQQLAFADRLVHANEALSVMGGCRISNGGNIMRKLAVAEGFVKEVGGDVAFYDSVPIKTRLISNSAYNDYVNVRRRLGGRLEKFPLNMGNYFAQCYRDITFAQTCFGADMSAEMQIWRQTLSGFDQALRQDVARRLRPINREMLGRRLHLQQVWKVLRQYPKRMAFDDVLHYVKHEASPKLGALFPEMAAGLRYLRSRRPAGAAM